MEILFKNGLDIHKKWGVKIPLSGCQRKEMSLVEFTSAMSRSSLDRSFVIGISLLSALIRSGYNKYEIVSENELTEINDRYVYYRNITHNIEDIVRTSNIKPSLRNK